MIRIPPVFLLLTFLSGCANPQYASEENTTRSKTEDASSCIARFPTSENCVSIIWKQTPTTDTFGTFLIKIWRPNLADGSPVLQTISDEVSALLWMPSMGHGSSPMRVELVDTGTYRASDVFFTMPGEWEIRIQVKTGGAISDEVAIPFIF